MITSRERLLKSIRHEPIDRVPVSTYELVGWNMDSWENKEISYRRLMDEVRQYTDCIYMTNIPRKPGEGRNQLVETREWTEGISRYIEEIHHAPKGDFKALYRIDENVHTTWILKHMLGDIDEIDDYLSMPFKPFEPDMAAFYNESERLGDKGVMMLTIGDPICTAADLFGMSDLLMYIVKEPDRIKYLFDALHERQMYNLKNILKHNVKDVIFRICGPEYATPPYLSPDYFYNYVTCYLIDICREIKAAGAIPRIHSHGRIGKVLNQLAMTEAEGIDPVEPPPDGDITLAEVKKMYGSKFCLFGNIEMKELEYSDRERMDVLVKEAMDAAKEGGGFVLMPTACPINVPLSAKTEENYLQMIESALKYGQY